MPADTAVDTRSPIIGKPAFVAFLVMVLIGLAWIPVIQGARGLYEYLQGVQGYLAPPIFVVFFLGIFSKRLNGPGCLATLIVGFIMGLVRLAIDTPVALIQEEGCAVAALEAEKKRLERTIATLKEKLVLVERKLKEVEGKTPPDTPPSESGEGLLKRHHP